jgi:transposase
MISRSSKIRLKYANNIKKQEMNFLFQDVIIESCLDLVNDLIYQDKIQPLLPKNITDRLPFTGRINQLLAKECSSVARSIKSKIDKIKDDANLKKYQEELINKFKDKTFKIKSINQFNIDSRFVEIQENVDSKEFDYWIKLKFPKRSTIYLPIKSTRHIKNLLNRGYTMKNNTIRIKSNGEIELYFNKEKQENNNTETIGIDIGRNKSYITNNGLYEVNTKVILNNLKNKKHGSKNKASCVRKLKQTIDKEIKKIDFKNLKTIYLEKLNYMKKGKRWGNINHHWSYTYIQNRIKLHAEEQNVSVQEVYAAYTSQTCSSCGFKHKNNRNSEKFLCLSCEYEIDADLNAAKNIHNRGLNSSHYH